MQALRQRITCSLCPEVSASLSSAHTGSAPACACRDTVAALGTGIATEDAGSSEEAQRTQASGKELAGLLWAARLCCGVPPGKAGLWQLRVQAGVLLPSASAEFDSIAPAGSPPPAPYTHPSRWAYLRVAQQVQTRVPETACIPQKNCCVACKACASPRTSKKARSEPYRDASGTAWRRALTGNFRYDQEAQHRLCTQQENRHCRSSVRILWRVQAPQHAPRARPERGRAARRRHDFACPKSVFGHEQQHKTLASSQAGEDVSSASVYYLITQNHAPVKLSITFEHLLRSRFSKLQKAVRRDPRSDRERWGYRVRCPVGHGTTVECGCRLGSTDIARTWCALEVSSVYCLPGRTHVLLIEL